jgi:hypothetical protein
MNTRSGYPGLDSLHQAARVKGRSHENFYGKANVVFPSVWLTRRYITVFADASSVKKYVLRLPCVGKNVGITKNLQLFLRNALMRISGKRIFSFRLGKLLIRRYITVFADASSVNKLICFSFCRKKNCRNHSQFVSLISQISIHSEKIKTQSF